MGVVCTVLSTPSPWPTRRVEFDPGYERVDRDRAFIDCALVVLMGGTTVPMND